MNRPARFTVSDVVRAIKAAKQAGSGFAIEIAPDGTIRLVPHKGGASLPPLTVEPEEEIVL